MYISQDTFELIRTLDITKGGELKLSDLRLLLHLETLKLLNTGPWCRAGRLSDSFICSESLKSLSLSNTYLDWKEAWAFEMIPILEVQFSS